MNETDNDFRRLAQMGNTYRKSLNVALSDKTNHHLVRSCDAEQLIWQTYQHEFGANKTHLDFAAASGKQPFAEVVEKRACLNSALICLTKRSTARMQTTRHGDFHLAPLKHTISTTHSKICTEPMPKHAQTCPRTPTRTINHSNARTGLMLSG